MNLLSVQGEGFAYTLIALFICIGVIHLVRLAVIGYRAMHKKPAPPPKKQEKTTEPVYYIVEKKKKRAKAEYSEPKRIQFK